MADISTIYEAIKDGDSTIVETYLDSITNVNNNKLRVIDALLAFAANEDQLEIVKLLVNYNGNPEVYNNWLMKYAYDHGKLSLIEYLSTGK